MSRTATLDLTANERTIGRIAYTAASERYAVSYETADGIAVVTDTRNNVPQLVMRLIDAGYRVTGCVRVR